MAKEPFIQPRFVGPRFEEHTLPLSAAKDLAAYEELVVELAKHLYLTEHKERQRVPKGFADGFHLHIEKVQEGSTIPVLALVAVGALLNPLPKEFDDARELINEVISTPETDRLPSKFPKELYSYFNRIGRSLENGERLEWNPANSADPAALTPSKRKRLALAVGETYEAEVDVVGQIFSLDTDKFEGRLRLDTGEKIAFDFEPPFLEELKDALGNNALYAHLEGVATFDVNDRLKSIKEIFQLEVVPHYALISAIDSLNELTDGWLEGSGRSFNATKLSDLSASLSEVFPAGLSYPDVSPTEEGHVSLEWRKPSARIELEVNFSTDQLELYATDLEKGTFIEETFDYSQWETAFSKISALVRS